MGLLDFLSDPQAQEDMRKRAMGLLSGAGSRLTQGASDQLNAVGSYFAPGATQQQQQDAIGTVLGGPAGLLGVTAYHGSPHLFYKFSTTATKTTAGPLNNHGVFLSPDKATGARYASDFGNGKGVNYTVDAAIEKPLTLSARDYHSLGRYVSKIDSGKALNEVEDIGLEQLLAAHGIKHSGHPIAAIKAAGFDSISSGAGRGGAERELLVFDPDKLKILGRE